MQMLSNLSSVEGIAKCFVKCLCFLVRTRKVCAYNWLIRCLYTFVVSS